MIKKDKLALLLLVALTLGVATYWWISTQLLPDVVVIETDDSPFSAPSALPTLAQWDSEEPVRFYHAYTEGPVTQANMLAKYAIRPKPDILVAFGDAALQAILREDSDDSVPKIFVARQHPSSNMHLLTGVVACGGSSDSIKRVNNPREHLNAMLMSVVEGKPVSDIPIVCADF